MNDDEIVTRVIALAASIAGPERTPQEVGPETPLTEGGFWLDSVALVEVIVACEAEFFVEFDSEEDLTTAALESIGSLASVIQRKLAE
jgi:acyl carrier protein